MSLPIKNFHGEINGKSVKDYLKELDYSLQTYSERLELTQNIFKNCTFFYKYFDNWHKVHPNKEDFLSEDRNICKALEKIADYLLFSPDSRENDKTNYIFYKDNNLTKKLDKDQSYDNVPDNTIVMFIDKNRNYKKEVKQQIKSTDFQDHDFDSDINYYIISDDEILENVRKGVFDLSDKLTYLYTTHTNLLKDNQEVIDYYSNLIQTEMFENYTQKRKMIDLMREIKGNSIMIKDKIKGTIYYNHCLPDSTQPDLWLTNYSDALHIMALLKSTNTNLLTDIGVVTYDLEQLLEQVKLNDFEEQVLNLWKISDMTQETIAEKLSVSQPFISQTLTKICNKIVKKYKSQYQDWLYLNYLKGEYKQCSGCGKIKLVQLFHWDKSNNNYKSLCKSCSKEKNTNN